jgi:hypothetical protein
MVRRLGAGRFTRRLEADEQGGGVVHPGGEVLLDRKARLVGHLDDAFAVALAEHPQAVGFPVAAVEPQDLRDPGPGGQQQQDQRSVAHFGQRVVGQCFQELVPVTGFQGLGESFGQLGYVDGGPEVAG